MTKQPGAVNVALLLICSFPLLAQKQVPPQAIRFQGAPQYTQQELLASAGLKPGTRLNSGEIKARARQLNDTGLFKEVKFSSDRKTLLFTLTPSSQLFPMHLEKCLLLRAKNSKPSSTSASRSIAAFCQPVAPRSKESAGHSTRRSAGAGPGRTTNSGLMREAESMGTSWDQRGATTRKNGPGGKH